MGGLAGIRGSRRDGGPAEARQSSARQAECGVDEQMRTRRGENVLDEKRCRVRCVAPGELRLIVAAAGEDIERRQRHHRKDVDNHGADQAGEDA